MSWRVILHAIVSFSLFMAGRAIHWTSGPEDGSSLYACAGEDLQLTWVFSLSPGDAAHDAQWVYNGHSQELIALYSHGTFVPLPTYSHRAQYLANGGLRLSHVTVADSGNYSVEVTGADNSGAQFSLRRYVLVVVADDLLTIDGHVHVTLSAAAVNRGHQWALELRCGLFTFPSPPPYDVQWITPWGQVQASSRFSDGHFSLFLSAPIAGGRYACQVSSQTPSTCARADAEASVTVDSTTGRLTLLEATLQDTRTQLAASEARLSSSESQLSAALTELLQMREELNRTARQLTARWDRGWDTLHAENVEVRQEVANTSSTLLQRVANIESRTGPSVSFYAWHLTSFNEHLIAGSPVVARDVVTNIGGGYDRTTGSFTAPYAGVYFFAATTGPFHSEDRAGLKLMADDVEVAFVSAYNQNATDQTATLHAVLRLAQDRRVWLQACYPARYWSDATSFSGFLISLDP